MVKDGKKVSQKNWDKKGHGNMGLLKGNID